jgi:hypothetical protein
MPWPETLSALAIASALVVLFGWLGARPPNFDRGPRLVPYRFLMLLSAVVVEFLLVHVKELAGLSPTRN